LFGALFTGASFLIAGCSDLPTAPTPDVADPSYSLLNDLTTLLQPNDDHEVRVLRRRVALDHDEVESAVIGPWGGTIRLEEAGLTVRVPMGALRGYTRITVTAPAGDLVGYYFAPHGLQFERPLTVSQDLFGTEGLGLLNGLSVAYFEGDLEPSVTALESLPLWLLRLLGIFQVEHFSGYVIAVD
jgi:hypothetical protein